MRRAHFLTSGFPVAAACLAGLGVLDAPAWAAADQPVLQTDAAKVALEPYAAPSTLGGRAQFSASLGSLDTLLTAAVERGGGGLTVGGDAWTEAFTPSAWVSDEVRFGANWALDGATRLSVEAGDHARWTRSFNDALISTPDEQMTLEGGDYLRVHATSQMDRFSLETGAETATTTLDTKTLDSPGATANRLWISSRKLYGSLSWRPWSWLSLQGGEAAQSFTAGWRNASVLGGAYLTPGVSARLTPWSNGEWKLSAEQTLSPIDPSKVAAYVQIATPGVGFAPQPDRGWRYGLRLDQQLPGGIKLSAEGADWRLTSITEMGPVGPGEAPVGVGPAQRQEVALNLSAPLNRIGLPGASLEGQVNLRRSQVVDPFTGQRRVISGESPFAAELSVGGALPAPNLSWSLKAQADGPQSLYQMAQVTNLGATAGLGGALTYGLGGVKLSLEVDNLVGGARDVTTLSYAGPRGEDSLSNVARRKDDSRAVRIALHRGL